MAQRLRAIDWSETHLGPTSQWSATLRMMIGFLLANRFPLLLWWGPEYVQIYNDAYTPIPGTKHPRSVGQRASECWPEIWNVIGPLIDTPFRGGPATWMDDIELEPNRHGFAEETHFTIAYSPVPDADAPGGIGGVLATVHEITQQVFQERRVRILRDLGIGALETRSVEQACESAVEVFNKNPKDTPFVMIYLLEDMQQEARLVATAGVPEGAQFAPPTISVSQHSPWPFGAVVAGNESILVSDLGSKFVDVPPGPSGTPKQAMLVPIRSSLGRRLAGIAVFGISPRIAVDEFYRSFFDLAAAQIATAISNAQAYEEERRRAEALDAIDRAKTAFFSNVSHEFRTPLTLMLGPVEEALRDPRSEADPKQRERLELIRRNGLRLQKLVNTLLEFSRIEAGRIEANYEPTDLPAFTAQLAGMFESAINRAGLRLAIDCPPASETAYVDRDMWEKIVMNLLSNALKFTLEGEVAVSLRKADGAFELTVRDTGVGIPPEEMPRLFERFHRIRHAQARTHEGTGIGLAFVHELVRLHNGQLTANSELNKGTEFVVRIPAGVAHLPPDRINLVRTLASTTVAANPYVEEALRWLPGDAGSPGRSSPLDAESIAAGATREVPCPGARVLVADDNADMRDYLRTLLGRYWSVETVSDGNAALERVREQRPELVVSDVMMPGLDGLEFLRAVRTDERLKELPVILLSARAGAEYAEEALAAGADVYLVKPFAARELIAYVSGHLELQRLRISRAAELKALNTRLQEADRRKDEFLAMLGHELRNPLSAVRNAVAVASLDETQRGRALAIAQRQTDQLARLIDDLLDVARVTQGRISLRKQRVSLAEIVQRAVENTQDFIAGRKVALDLSIPSEAVIVDGDPARLEQVFVNLLSNAGKYTDPGGRVTVTLVRGEKTATVRVSDTGIGISTELLPRIWDLFAQADQSLERSEGGLGIGLTVARRLVELHGGRIEAHSEGAGKGSDFVVVLPLASAIAGKGAQSSANGDPSRSLNVLLVEDNQDLAESTVLLLELLGHRVAAVPDGVTALESAHRQVPELMLVDIGLPGINGYEVARRVRSDPTLRNVLLVALTGYGRDEDKQAAIAAGFDYHLVKPIDPEALGRLLSVLS